MALTAKPPKKPQPQVDPAEAFINGALTRDQQGAAPLAAPVVPMNIRVPPEVRRDVNLLSAQIEVPSKDLMILGYYALHVLAGQHGDITKALEIATDEMHRRLLAQAR